MPRLVNRKIRALFKRGFKDGDDILRLSYLKIDPYHRKSSADHSNRSKAGEKERSDRVFLIVLRALTEVRILLIKSETC